ncbi:hypothetical protein OG394_24580 [Kribbella sp. NBC_01245]|uniref:hypothetical protein n=1 Tax=Kribbella sp. NBC_01245 TaxID=2903578 RepID=UPI002E2E170E|nr:hypothetical protein [Kribbella sp. NBC_01245]
MRLGRGLAIGAGVTVLAGFGLGLAVGSSADSTQLPTARKLPADLCKRLGDVSAFFPIGSDATLAQTGAADIRCRASVDERSQKSYTGAQLGITVTSHAAKVGSTAAQVARRAFDSRPWVVVEGRPYPTKIQRSENGEEQWAFKVITVRADTVVEVEYTAHPIRRETTEAALLILADRAVWEAK